MDRAALSFGLAVLSLASSYMIAGTWPGTDAKRRVATVAETQTLTLKEAIKVAAPASTGTPVVAASAEIVGLAD